MQAVFRDIYNWSVNSNLYSILLCIQFHKPFLTLGSLLLKGSVRKNEGGIGLRRKIIALDR